MQQVDEDPEAAFWGTKKEALITFWTWSQKRRNWGYFAKMNGKKVEHDRRTVETIVTAIIKKQEVKKGWIEGW